jgi:hypothetical protein
MKFLSCDKKRGNMFPQEIKNNSYEFANNFFLGPQRSSNSIILKVTMIVLSLFVLFRTYGVIHYAVGMGNVIYKNYGPLRSIPKKENIKSEDKKNNFGDLSSDILLNIFKFLPLDDLEEIRLVSKTWNKKASNRVLLQNMIINEIAFGNKNWMKAFGDNFIKKEDVNQDIKYLPKDFVEILLSKCQIDSTKKKRVYNTHLLVWLPKTVIIDGKEVNFILKTIEDLASKKSCFNYSFFMNQYRDKPMDDSGWMLFSKELLPESTCHSYIEQKEIVKKFSDKIGMPYEVPQTLPLIIALSANKIKSCQTKKTDKISKGLLGTISSLFVNYIKSHQSESIHWTRCKEGFNGDQITIIFSPSSLVDVDGYNSNLLASDCGISLMRRLK